MHWYPRYVPVDEQRARIVSEIHGLRARGVEVQPIELRGRAIARNFWGRYWCEHLESFSEYAARLAHGRAYVRNGSVCHLAIESGGVDAMVVGSALYHVTIRIRRLEESTWTAIRTACAGRIGSVVELRQGRLATPVMERVTDRDAGLFPQPRDIVPSCGCPDRATMCKHAAAVLAGVGARLDDNPELLFLLRGVAEKELITGAPASGDGTAGGAGVDLDARNGAVAPPAAESTTLHLAAPSPSTASTAVEPGGPGATDWATPPRTVKKTLTYRPPSPARSHPRITSADLSAADEAVGFQPTGELVAGLREQCGCSVVEFADLIQVTPTTVRRWETTSGPLNLHARPWEALQALYLEVEKHAG